MLCCFFNTLNGILSLLGFAGIGIGLSVKQNNYIFGGLLGLNMIIMAYFGLLSYKKKVDFSIVKWMVLGFSLVNINYIYKLIENNKKFCRECINYDNDCCHLDCGHEKHNDCYHENGFQHKSVNKINLLFNILNFIGLIINIISFINYYRSHHQCKNTQCSHEEKSKKSKKSSC